MDYFSSTSILIELYYIGQLILALVLGGMLGWQRERWGKWAGPRTYALVTAGSTLFTVLSLNAFGSSPAMVAAGIVTGIGFLGAGTILHKENRVEGLTTAAGLWISAAIGMAVGIGYYLLAIGVSIMVLLIFMFNDLPFRKCETEIKIKGKKV
jgi:putative Mg2+ transporter-C (MgtC) family protein